MKRTHEAYGVVEAEEGLWYETLADDPMEAIRNIPDDRAQDLHSLYVLMMSGKVRVHCVRVEIMGEVDPNALHAAASEPT